MKEGLDKRCPCCGKFKPLTEEHYYRFPSRRGFSVYCVICSRKRNSESYQRNKDKAIKRNTEYQKRTGWKHQKAYVERNPLLIRYRHLKLRHFGRCDFVDFERWYPLQPDVCHYCKIGVAGKNKTIDRVDNTRGYFVDNMVIACLACNSSKWQQSAVNHKGIYRVTALEKQITRKKGK